MKLQLVKLFGKQKQRKEKEKKKDNALDIKQISLRNCVSLSVKGAEQCQFNHYIIELGDVSITIKCNAIPCFNKL